MFEDLIARGRRLLEQYPGQSARSYGPGKELAPNSSPDAQRGLGKPSQAMPFSARVANEVYRAALELAPKYPKLTIAELILQALAVLRYERADLTAEDARLLELGLEHALGGMPLQSVHVTSYDSNRTLWAGSRTRGITF